MNILGFRTSLDALGNLSSKIFGSLKFDHALQLHQVKMGINHLIAKVASLVALKAIPSTPTISKLLKPVLAWWVDQEESKANLSVTKTLTNTLDPPVLLPAVMKASISPTAEHKSRN